MCHKQGAAKSTSWPPSQGLRRCTNGPRRHRHPVWPACHAGWIQVPSCSYRLFLQMARGSTFCRCRGTHVHARTLQHLFSRFGLPRQLHSDQGSNFESKLVAELCSIAGINITPTTPFHSRSDGQTERANRTILQMLRASIDAQPEYYNTWSNWS